MCAKQPGCLHFASKIPRFELRLCEFSDGNISQEVGADSFVRALPGSIHSIDPKIPYERAKERVIYIAKEVAANMCNSIHSIRRSAIQFHLHHDLRIEQVYPESLWDSQCNQLLVPEPDRFWGIVYISDLEGSRGVTDVSKWTKRPVSWYHVCGFHLLSYLRLAPIDSI